MPLHSMPNITGLQSKVQAQLTLSQAANTIRFFILSCSYCQNFQPLTARPQIALPAAGFGVIQVCGHASKILLPDCLRPRYTSPASSR